MSFTSGISYPRCRLPTKNIQFVDDNDNDAKTLFNYINKLHFLREEQLEVFKTKSDFQLNIALLEKKLQVYASIISS